MCRRCHRFQAVSLLPEGRSGDVHIQAPFYRKNQNSQRHLTACPGFDSEN